VCSSDLQAYPFYKFRSDNYRYGACNLNAVRKFLSLEFRGMRGTFDTQLIEQWMTILYLICSKAKDFNHPEHLMDSYYRSNKEEFFTNIVGRDMLDVIVGYAGPEWVRLVDQSSKIVADIAYATDWNHYASRCIHSTTKPSEARRAETLSRAQRLVAERAQINPVEEYMRDLDFDQEPNEGER
jgi:hypothetical protein